MTSKTTEQELPEAVEKRFDKKFHLDYEDSLYYFSPDGVEIKAFLASELARQDERHKGEVEKAREDSKRLDFLDKCNQALNESSKTDYGWRLILNHNVIRLMSKNLEIDLNDSNGGNNKFKSCREAIDEALTQREGEGV